MTWLAEIPHGAVIGLDTAPFVYLVEDHPQYLDATRWLFEGRLMRGLNTAVTSVVTLAEVLVKPLAQGRMDLVARYREILDRGHGLRMVDVSGPTAFRAASLRAQYGIRLPDAFQIAAAIEGGASVFVTNDGRLRRLREIRVIVLSDWYTPPDRVCEEGPQGPAGSGAR